MKISSLVTLSVLVPLFSLMSAVRPPADTSSRMIHLRFSPVAQEIGDAGAKECTWLITNRAQYEQVFGEQRVIDVDFENEWVFFYSAGWMPTTGYEASVLDVAYRPDAQTLVFTTELVSPGRSCVELAVMNKPYSVVRFPHPPGRVQVVRYAADDLVVDCR